MKTLLKKVGSTACAISLALTVSNVIGITKATANPANTHVNSQMERLIRDGAIGPAPAPSDIELKAKGKTRGEKAVTRALPYIGLRENPFGSNCQPFSVYFGMPCVPWCALFVSKNFDLNGDRKLSWTYVASVSSILEWGQRTGNISRTPRRGDIFILKGNGESHTGIVRSVNGNRYTTVEGNYDNSVQSVIREITSNTYFVRVP
jgi:hypothetical protein